MREIETRTARVPGLLLAAWAGFSLLAIVSADVRAAETGLTTITQNVSTDVVPATWPYFCATCIPNATGVNRWLRRFDLPAEFGITVPTAIRGVDFGVERAGGPRGEIPVYVFLRSIPKSLPLTWENTTVITSYASLVSASTPRMVHFPFAAPFDHPLADDLVVEVTSVDGCNAVGGWMWSYFQVGVNDFGETKPTYWSGGSGCTIRQPVPLRSVNRLQPTSCMVMQVQVLPGYATATSSESWGRLKTMYR